ncbi:DUF7373 family lipoprotein [Nocardia otitidiscaviarum]|uniref:DUF7373 family lipoprotein n=1 Tax=Nocardia otitidiscaviarum TaxID=1823 RepID=UPI001896383A|nr:hypothetical protein [Nocardia otitidiscaviarum]MBF6181479.1 hypothetical protein [Nocardia otitidiscaviarum]
MSSRYPRTGRTPAILIAALTLLAACTIEGEPVAHHADLSTLDTGAYSVDSLAEPQPGIDRHGRVVESVRLAESMIDPVEADHALTEPLGAVGLFLMPTPATAATLLAEPVRAVLEQHGMITGAAVGGADRSVPNQPTTGAFRGLTVMVFRFPDTASAQAAAQQIDSVDAAVSTDNVPVSIADYPAGHAHWRPGVPTLAATVASESYVISVLAAHTESDLGALTTLARNAFGTQIQRLRDFAPTPADQLTALPLDRDGMLARMVPLAPGRWPYPEVITFAGQVVAGWDSSLYATGIVLGPRALQLWAGRTREGLVPAEAHAVNNLDALYRYPTAASARAAFERLRSKDAERDARPTAGPAGISAEDVHCTEEDEPDQLGLTRFLCVVRYGRYVAAVFTRELSNLRQKTAAQYGLLVNGGP